MVEDLQYIPVFINFIGVLRSTQAYAPIIQQQSSIVGAENR